MITNFKIFENVNFDLDELMVGDYVIIKPYIGYEKYHNKLGRVISMRPGRWGTLDEIIIRFGNEFERGVFGETDLLYWSHNKEELELLLASKKYNL